MQVQLLVFLHVVSTAVITVLAAPTPEPGLTEVSDSDVQNSSKISRKYMP